MHKFVRIGEVETLLNRLSVCTLSDEDVNECVSKDDTFSARRPTYSPTCKNNYQKSLMGEDPLIKTLSAQKKIMDCQNQVHGRAVENKLGRLCVKPKRMIQPKILEHVESSPRRSTTDMLQKTPISSKTRGLKLKIGSAKKLYNARSQATSTTGKYLQPRGESVMADPSQKGK